LHHRPLDILYSDNHLFVVNKPAGVPVQRDRSASESVLDLAREHIKAEFDKRGNVFLGLVHRLDRPVSGVVVFARTSKAAARLSDQFRQRSVEKKYWALVEGQVPPGGTLEDYIVRRGTSSFINTSGAGKNALLSYRALHVMEKLSFVEIELETGRHHQIRVQFASRGHPVLGDVRYGAKIEFEGKALALHARSIVIRHPTRDEKLSFTADPGETWYRFIRM
jgi:23S rRNA pseudouridine1911/1915/1917 synthase